MVSVKGETRRTADWKFFCSSATECKDDIALSWLIAEMENGKLQS